MDDEIDGDEEIESKNGEYEEVKERIEAAVIFEVLRCGHEWSFLGAGGNSIASQGTGFGAVGLENEEADWCACRDGWWGLDLGGASG